MKKKILFLSSFILILMLNLVLANTSKGVTLTDLDPKTEITVNEKVYTIELVSASDLSATIKVTDANGKSESKEINENQSKEVNGLNIKLEAADETNLHLSAYLIITFSEEEEETKNEEDKPGITLTSDDPKKSISISGESYLIELISATDNSATLMASQTKEISFLKSENSERIGGFSIKLHNAEESNLKLLVDISIEEEGEAKSLTNEDPKTQLTFDEEPYTIELVSASDLSAIIKVTADSTGNSESQEISERTTGEIMGLLISVIQTDETNSAISSQISIGKKRFLLTDESPKRRVNINGESYYAELVSASDSSATIKISQTEEITEGSSNNLLNLEIKVKEAEETNLVLFANLIVEKSEKEDEEEVENEDEEENKIFMQFTLTNEDSIIGVNINERINIIQLISATETSATIRVINEQGDTQTKEINEGKLEAIKGVRIKVVNSAENNLELSAEIIVYGASAEVDLEKIKPNEETGPINIPKKEKIVCDGCSREDKCYPLGYRKSGEFCSENKEFVIQLEGSSSCDNNFECDSNLCVSDECVSQGLIKKLISWFKNFFGFD